MSYSVFLPKRREKTTKRRRKKYRSVGNQGGKNSVFFKGNGKKGGRAIRAKPHGVVDGEKA